MFFDEPKGGALVRTYYLALSKVFHSDVPHTGDKDFMAEIGEAYEELTDPDGLESAIDLYVSGGTTQAVRQN